MQYGIVGTGSVEIMNVSESETTTISNLMPSTNYSIQVAAINNAGTGNLSAIIFSLTQGIYTKHVVAEHHVFNLRTL